MDRADLLLLIFLLDKFATTETKTAEEGRVSRDMWTIALRSYERAMKESQ